MKTFTDISLIIPAYDKDIYFISDLLKKIYSFDNLPKQIIIVASGLNNLAEYVDINYLNQQFPEVILCQSSKRVNQAKARNIGAKFATSKLIMFHDVDDIPHSQKFVITERIFIQDPSIDFLVHGYSVGDGSAEVDFLKSNIQIDYSLRPHTKTMGLAGATDMPIHNSHVTIHKKVFDKFNIKYDESSKAYRVEDSLLTVELLKIGLQGAMICAPLVHYQPSSNRK